MTTFVGNHKNFKEAYRRIGILRARHCGFHGGVAGATRGPRATFVTKIWKLCLCAMEALWEFSRLLRVVCVEPCVRHMGTFGAQMVTLWQ